LFRTIDHEGNGIEGVKGASRYHSNTNSRPVSKESEIDKILGLRLGF
jgi:hypothetical protein